MKGSINLVKETCVHCHKCQEACLFLKKYGIDIGDQKKLGELAYHCFLCGKCSAVCPKGIDGRQSILSMRQAQVEVNCGKLKEKGYSMLLKEKQDYIFRNYRHLKGKSVLFPGCNFPSFYPKTMRKLMKLIEEKTDIGVVFDCCGKPIGELGLKVQEEAIIAGLNERFRQAGIEEVVMLCPNCYHFLKGKLNAHVVSIYEKLFGLGIKKKIKEDMAVFLPCPDRESKEILGQAKPFLQGRTEPIKNVQCCGLGGCARAKEPEVSDLMADAVKQHRDEKVYTYCASCAGNLARTGCKEVSHILVELLESDENPDIGKSAVNRMKTKFI